MVKTDLTKESVQTEHALIWKHSLLNQTVTMFNC